MISSQVPSFKFSFLRRLCTRANLPATIYEDLSSNQKFDAEDAAVTKVVGLLQVTDNGWDSEQLRSLLYVDSPFPARRILQVFRNLKSYSKALRLFRWLESDSSFINNSSLRTASFQILVEHVSEEADWKNQLQELLAISAHNNVPLSINASIRLICYLGNAGMINESFNVYNKLPLFMKNTHVRNMIMDSMLNVGCIRDPLLVLDEMLEKNAEFRPNDDTRDIIFWSLLRFEKLGRGIGEEKLLGLISKTSERGMFPHLACLTQFIDLFCRNGKIDSAWNILHTVIKFGGPLVAACFNILLTGLKNCGDTPRFNLLLAEMKEARVQPSTVTFGIIIDHLCNLGKIDEAVQVFEKTSEAERSNGVSIAPSAITYNTLISALCLVGRLEEALGLMQRMESDHHCSSPPNTFVFNTMINRFCRAGNMDKCNELFLKMKEMKVPPNGATLNILVEGMCRHGRADSAIKIFRELQEMGLGRCDYPYNILITLSFETKNIDMAKELFTEMIVKNVNPTVITYGAVINGYFLNGMIDDAMQIFRRMRSSTSGIRVQPNTVIYNTVIKGLCQNNDLEGAMSILDEMERDHVRSHSNTYIPIFRVIRKKNERNQLKEAFELMHRMKKAGCVPDSRIIGFLTPWFSVMGETEKLESFLAS